MRLTLIRSVLIAGAGYVSAPVATILASQGIHVVFGCRKLATAEKAARALSSKYPGQSSALRLDVRDPSSLNAALQGQSLVVSLVPPPDHPAVIEAAIVHRVPCVTTSYVSPEMAALDQRAKEAGVLVMNEIGLDPGLDHLWAVKCLEDIAADADSECISFESYCGGLPAPECSDNALGYRFSWSSAGVLRALNRVAMFLEDGTEKKLSRIGLMESARKFETPYKGYAFECYANGDSTPYAKRYPGLATARTIVRGTLRYEGFAAISKALIHLGFLDQNEQEIFGTERPWSEATAHMLGLTPLKQRAELLQAVLQNCEPLFGNNDVTARVLNGLKEIGLFDTERKLTPQKYEKQSPFFALCALLEESCMYWPGMRDMVFLQHTFVVRNKAHGGQKIKMATLVDYGDDGKGKGDGYTGMARLVGTPAAVACLRILRNADELHGLAGMVSPVSENIARPLRETLLKDYGIGLVETERSA
jgi:saccharopine dehydrogenase (NADP+, L-glutamate forming)